MKNTETSIQSHSSDDIVSRFDPSSKISLFLAKFPEYIKILRLALSHEDSAANVPNYQGWQWHDVQAHPTKLIRLVTEGIAKICWKTRNSTCYMLRDSDAVRKAIKRPSNQLGRESLD
jgi:hypothetical protein